MPLCSPRGCVHGVPQTDSSRVRPTDRWLKGGAYKIREPDMTPQQFKTLAAQGYTRIPLMREVLADLETPLSTYKKLADQPYSYLFESVQGGRSEERRVGKE